MKKIILILIAFSIIGIASAQTEKINNIPSATKTDPVSKLQDSVLNLKIDVAEKDSALQVQQDTIRKIKNENNELKDAVNKYWWNNRSPYYYAFGLIWVFLGVVLSWALIARSGMKNSERTSKEWDWKEFFKTFNIIKRIGSFIASVVGSFALLVFAGDWLGFEISMAFSFLIGLCLDYVLDWYDNKRKNPANTLKLPE